MRHRRRVVFLDRDGVLVVPEVRNGKSFASRRASDFLSYPGVAIAMLRLEEAGYDLVVATNQRDVARGLLDSSELARMPMRLTREVPLDRIRVRPHRGRDACDCRKPQPGLLLADDGLGPVDFALSCMGRDRDSDVAAGHAAGCRIIFIDRGWRDDFGLGADFVTDSLGTAVNVILSR